MRKSRKEQLYLQEVLAPHVSPIGKSESGCYLVRHSRYTKHFQSFLSFWIIPFFVAWGGSDPFIFCDCYCTKRYPGFAYKPPSSSHFPSHILVRKYLVFFQAKKSRRAVNAEWCKSSLLLLLYYYFYKK